MKTWTISEEEAGQKIIDYLQDKIGPHESRRKIKSFLEQNGCTINGEVANHATHSLEAGDVVQAYLPRLTELMPPVKALEADRVLYEDEQILVYNKPANINSEGEKSLIDLIRKQYPEAQLCHRLDRLTTGAIAIGKNPEVTKAIMEQFQNRDVEKTYWAVIDGIPEKNKGCIENYIGRTGFSGGQVKWGEVAKERGHHAITEWTRKTTGKGICLMRCYPKSGRTHQIRVHMNCLGYPILGDGQYCRKFRSSPLPPRPLLHARGLNFMHPLTNRPVRVRAPLPEDFMRTGEVLGLEIRQ